MDGRATDRERKTVITLNLMCDRASYTGVPGGKDLTSGECSLGQIIPI